MMPQGVLYVFSVIFPLFFSVLKSLYKPKRPAPSKIGERLRCHGDKVEPEGSVLKYVTEGENEVDATGRALCNFGAFARSFSLENQRIFFAEKLSLSARNLLIWPIT